MYEITILANQVIGSPDDLRRQQIEQFFRDNFAEGQNVKYLEEPIAPQLLRPSIQARYELSSQQQHEELIKKLDELLQQVGGYAVQAVVTDLTNYALEMATAGAAVSGGLGASAQSKEQERIALGILLGMLGGFIGGIIGKQMIKGKRLVLTGSKTGGLWTFQQPPVFGIPANYSAG